MTFFILVTSWFRITSYNVCYTKLLRDRAADNEQPDHRPGAAVDIVHRQLRVGPLEGKDGIAERRAQAADGQVDQEQGPEPDRVEAVHGQDRLVDSYNFV